MNHDTTSSTRGESLLSTHSVYGAPCWVSLTSRDVKATEEFYSAVLGWQWRPVRLGEPFRIALADGVPVAGIAAGAAVWGVGVAWPPYIAGRRGGGGRLS